MLEEFSGLPECPVVFQKYSEWDMTGFLDFTDCLNSFPDFLGIEWGGDHGCRVWVDMIEMCQKMNLSISLLPGTVMNSLIALRQSSLYIIGSLVSGFR